MYKTFFLKKWKELQDPQHWIFHMKIAHILTFCLFVGVVVVSLFSLFVFDQPVKKSWSGNDLTKVLEKSWLFVNQEWYENCIRFYTLGI